MKLGFALGTITEPYDGKAFALAPASGAIPLAQS